MKDTAIRNIIILHFALLIIAGFFCYDNAQNFYLLVQISSILIYIVSKNDLSAGNKILIDGLLLMTALETLDYIWMTNFNYTLSNILLDGLIVVISVILTAIRYFKNGKSI